MVDTVTFYMPIGEGLLKALTENGFTEWPPVWLKQMPFCSVSNKEDARRVAKKNNNINESVYLAKFEIKKSYLQKIKKHVVEISGGIDILLPSEKLHELNQNIVGKIEIVEKV